MGTIYSGVGLASGLDISSIVDQLVAASAGPRDQLVSRIGNIDAQKAAYLDISARISAMLANLTTLSSRSAFNATKSTSSQPDILGVTTNSAAVPGSYDFIVKQLATSHQLVSRGFTSLQDRLSSGTVTIESAAARVNTDTKLAELNGYGGVQRGAFTITDASGAEATVNIADALTLNDVIDRINGAGLAVHADVVGDSIRLTETTGGVVHVGEVDDGHVAADLGFAVGNRSSDAGGNTDELVGGSLVSLSGQTPLSVLNDGNGLRTAKAGGDFTINGITVDLSANLKPETRLEQLNGGEGVELGKINVSTFNENGSEVSHEVDLTGLSTVGEVKQAIEDAVPDVTVTLTSGRLVVGYSSTASSNSDGKRRLVVEDVDGLAARDLGIAGDSDQGRINGSDILTMRSVQDVLAAINFATENDGSVTARIDGARIAIDAGGAAVGLEAVGSSQALSDLGFEAGGFRDGATGGRLIRGLNTSLLSSLNGGRGYDLGSIQLSVGDPAAGGQSVDVDLSGFETLSEVVDAINAASDANGLGITAGYDRTGTRLTIRSDDEQTPISIKDVSGTFAEQAGLITQSGPEVRSDNLEKQYLSETTLLADLNGGAGVSSGKVKITNGDGLSVDVDLSNAKTLGDVISRINGTNFPGGNPFTVKARINDTGDGIVLEDSATGSVGLTVEDTQGTAARDLRLLGSSSSGAIDGSFELRIDVSSSDTLDDLVQRINEGTGLATASVLNDGSDVNPYRLQIAAKQTGSAGELLIDDTGVGLDLTTLSRAQDAAVVLGGSANSGFVVTSSTNTLTDIVPGVTLTLTGVSDQPVSVTVDRNTEDVVAAVDGFVSAFNTAIGRIDELTAFDPSTETAGLLLGDGTTQSVERRLFNLVTGNVPNSNAAFRRLSELGIRYDGTALTFDETKLQDAIAADPEAVADFFTDPDNGVTTWMKDQINEITQSDGLIGRRADALDRRKSALNDRIDQLNELLDRKRERLTRQFNAMESAISQLQAQQSSLDQLSSLAASAKSG